MARLSAEEVAAYVERTTREQGVPLKVTDPKVIAQVATLLRVAPPPRPQLPKQASWQQEEEARELLAQGYHRDRVAARIGVHPAALRHLVADDGYAKTRGNQ